MIVRRKRTQIPSLPRATAVLALLVTSVAGSADSYGQDREVLWTVTAPDTIAAGSDGEIVFEASINPGWYIYAIDSPAGRPLQIIVDELPEGFSAGDATQSGPVEGYDPNFDATVRYFEQYAEFRLPVTAAIDASQGTQSVSGRLDYMYCSDRVCIPASEPFSVHFDVTAAPTSALGAGGEADEGAKADEGGQTDEPATSLSAVPNDLERARSGGLLAFLILAVGAGFAAIFTPCVFPMIPLTISFFSHQSKNRSQAIRMAIGFGLSIILIFTGLGVLMAAILGAAGAQLVATNPWINLFIGAIFVVFALSLLGLFELRLPHQFVNYVNDQGNTKSGIIGVLFMGLTLALVSFSCTAPFVGGLLAATASNEWTWPVLGMLAFSATFALPFILFALFPNWLNSLPKSGAWMKSVTISLGFIELAAAFKFLSNADLVWGWGVLSRPLVIAAWIVIFVLAGMYLLGKLNLIHDEPPESIGTVRLMFAIGFLGLGLYLLPGLMGAPLNSVDAFLPPRKATDVSLSALIAQRSGAGESVDGLDWHGNEHGPYRDALDEAFATSEAEDKPILIDFTGYTCTNCRQMETNVFPNPAVADRLRNHFVLLRLFTDDATEGPDLQRYQLQLTGTVALPTYAVVDANGTLLHRWQGIASVDEFTSFLDQSTDKHSLVVRENESLTDNARPK